MISRSTGTPLRLTLILFSASLLVLASGCQPLRDLMSTIGGGVDPASQTPTQPQLDPTEPAVTEAPTGTVEPDITIAPGTEPGIGSTWERPADGMLMVYVPAGEFLMGSNDGEPDEAPEHTVFLDAFWIDQTEVTNAMYGMCEASGGCVTHVVTNSMFQANYYGNPEFANYPTVGVSWQNASDYCVLGWRETAQRSRVGESRPRHGWAHLSVG